MDLGWRGLGFESSGLEGCRDELVSALEDWIDLVQRSGRSLSSDRRSLICHLIEEPYFKYK